MPLQRPIHVLFVCSDNVALSPLAAGLMARHAEDQGVALRVASAGLAEQGKAFNPTTTWLLSNRNVKFDRTVSKTVDDQLVDGADLVLTMTHEQAALLAARFGLRRVFTVGQFGSALPARPDGRSVGDWLDSLSHFPDAQGTDGRWDIEDLAGKPDSTFLRVDVELDSLTRHIVSLLASADGSEIDVDRGSGAAQLDLATEALDLRLHRTGDDDRAPEPTPPAVSRP